MCLTNKFFACCLIFLSLNAYAVSNDATKVVAHTYQQWCDAIATAKGDPNAIIKFYAPNAILLPTLSNKIMFNKKDGLVAYFKPFTQHEGITCHTDKLITRIYGDIAINNGLYTFTYKEDGKMKVVPARFTFIYEKKLNEWLIITHHSSKLPL
jgi:uncharacterized protein (TIGR02246 family)